MCDSSCSNSWKDGRRLCTFCHQYLAESAYYRHTNDKIGSICPGKLESVSPSVERNAVDELLPDEELLSSSDDNISVNTESSFDFESSEDQFSDNELLQDNGSDIDSTQDTNPDDGCFSEADHDESMSIVSDSSYEFDFQSDLDEEIWEDSDDNVTDSTKLSCSSSEDHPQGENVILGISLFLNYFQLTYNVSEHAMSAFLMFVRLLLVYLASLAQGNIVFRFISKSISKSMYTVRKIINIEYGITEYAVCPKCHKLYNLSDCVSVNCGREESKIM